MACQLQGIALFDGIYEDWVIRDNTVIVDHWHGITIMGARRVAVSGNTVFYARPGPPGAPRITKTAHKDGRPSENSIIRNNTLQSRPDDAPPVFRQPQPGVRSVGNQIVDAPPDDLLHRK